MPEPVGAFHTYCGNLFYRLDQCPQAVQDFCENAVVARWSPESRRWENDTIVYDKRHALVFTRAKRPERSLVPRTCFERAPLRVGKELLYADYRTSYLTDDGSVPKNLGVTCMVSVDNGRRWKRRSTIALDPQGKDAMTEPMLAQNVSGELVCVIRRTDHQQKPMCMTFSKDRGKTWQTPVSLDQLGAFGVRPCLLQLECGVMILSYGRPSVWLTASLSGTGHEWTDPICILRGDPKELHKATDGYTSMIPIGKNRVLLAYTDFQHVDAEGRCRKAVLVRTLTIESK
jgi:hypothetical protein